MDRDREAFEASGIDRKHSVSLKRYSGNGEYISERTHDIWLGWQAALAYVREGVEPAGIDAQEAWNQRADDANQWNNLGGDEREDIIAIWEHGYAAGRKDSGKPYVIGVDLASSPDTTVWYCPACGSSG